MCYHTKYTDRVREYSSAASVNGDFLVTDPAYLMAAEVFAQTPSPPNVKIGRRALPYTQVTHLTCTSTSATDTYVFSLRTPGGSFQNLSIASTGVANTDVATINTAVTALAISGLTATHTTSPAVLVLTMASGKLLDIKTDPVHMTLADVTADPGIATDLAAILAADPAWYGVLLDSQSPAEISAAATWTEANKKLFIANCSDTAISDPASTTDVAYTLKQSAWNRTALLYAQTETLCYSACGWVGVLFPTDAGSENWAFKTIVGVPADNLTDNQVHAVENKNASVYTPIFGDNLTQFGKLPSGEWIDITRGTDALTNDLQVGILSLQANSKKVPMTDAGIDQYRSVIMGSLKRFIDVGFISDTPAPFVKLPLAKDISPVDKAARNLPGASFSATLAGAINSATLNGVLTV
jgi:hypothetical protein